MAILTLQLPAGVYTVCVELMCKQRYLLLIFMFSYSDISNCHNNYYYKGEFYIALWMLLRLLFNSLVKMTEKDLLTSQVTVAVETSVSQTLTVLELRSLLAQLETAVWELVMASHMVLQETVVNALVSIIIMHDYGESPYSTLCIVP